MRRLTVSLKRRVALSASRVTIGKDKLVYVLICDKKIRYPFGKSKIAYIGTTEKGISRIALSVAYRAEEILSIRGVRDFDARVITCKPRQNVKTWMKLERALLLTFRDKYGEVPHCNSHGKKMKETDEFKYFKQSRLVSILEDLA